jgi:hypothetical protein
MSAPTRDQCSETALLGGQVMGLVTRLDPAAAEVLIGDRDFAYGAHLAALLRVRRLVLGEPDASLAADLFAALDAALAPDVAAGVLHRGTVLAVLMTLRDVCIERDPEVRAGSLVAARCEAAAAQAKGGGGC